MLYDYKFTTKDVDPLDKYLEKDGLAVEIPQKEAIISDKRSFCSIRYCLVFGLITSLSLFFVYAVVKWNEFWDLFRQL